MSAAFRQLSVKYLLRFCAKTTFMHVILFLVVSFDLRSSSIV